jgi:type I restriction enzyme R subunit
MRAFLEAVLSAYEKSGVEELSLESLPALLTVKYGGLSDAKARLGDPTDIRRAFIGIQADIYRG